MQLFLVQMLHHFTDVLRVLAACNEQSVLGFDHDQIAYAYSGDELSGGMHIISVRVQDENACPINDIALS